MDSFGVSYPGYNYLLTHKNLSSGFYEGIIFINQSDINQSGDPVCQEFYLDSSDPINPILKEIKDNGVEVAITSDKFMINSIKFGINGEDGSVNGAVGAAGDNNIQPRVTIFLEIQTKGDNNQSINKIQTTVSQRDLNVP